MLGISNCKSLRVKFSNGQEIEAAGYSDDCLIAMVEQLRQFNNETETSSINDKLDQLIEIGENIMATLAEFQTKIDTINANTTKSAAAAAVVVQRLVDLKEQLTNAGLPAAEEAAVLANLDVMIGTTESLAAFLEATAAAPGPEPVPVPLPEPVA